MSFGSACIFLQGSLFATIFLKRLDGGPESLLLTWSVVSFWISKIRFVLHMFPKGLAFSSWHLCFHLSVTKDVLGMVMSCPLILKEFVSLSLQYINKSVYPWLVDTVQLSCFGEMYFSISSGILDLNLVHNILMSMNGAVVANTVTYSQMFGKCWHYAPCAG